MIFMRILPGVLKELMKHVPTVLFQTVEWSEIMSEIPVISRRMLQKEGYATLADQQKELLKDLPLCVRHENVNGPKLKAGDGRTILSLYFRQLFSPHGVFLDLRSLHFDHETDVLLWNPGSLWTKFSPEFSAGLIEVYNGFYLGNDEEYRSGLKQIGLLDPSWPPEDQAKIMEIFRTHFGAAQTGNVHFKLENLRSGIVSMAQFLLERKTRIKKDFLYLGIYLVTMYGTLEETGEALPVKDIYLSSRIQIPLTSVKS
jgi:hypothetical protein